MGSFKTFASSLETSNRRDALTTIDRVDSDLISSCGFLSPRRLRLGERQEPTVKAPLMELLEK